jgi:hypothetical protein
MLTVETLRALLGLRWAAEIPPFPPTKTRTTTARIGNS